MPSCVKDAGRLRRRNRLNDLMRTQSLLKQRESDHGAVQSSLQGLESESKRLGETHTTARFSLRLEVDRLKRDLEPLEDDLSRARKEIDDKETKHRDREGAIDKLHAENRDLASQLAAQTQARLNVADKLDGVQGQLRTAESEVATFRGRVNELEQRLSKDQRSLLSAESQYRDQLTERNTLLLTIYRYMDKILVLIRLRCVFFSPPLSDRRLMIFYFIFCRRKEVKQRRNHSPTSASSTIT
jgi:chromosome segregation ATPase